MYMKKVLLIRLYYCFSTENYMYIYTETWKKKQILEGKIGVDNEKREQFKSDLLIGRSFFYL